MITEQLGTERRAERMCAITMLHEVVNEKDVENDAMEALYRLHPRS